jgi:RHS repeat-associated protein
MARFASGVSLFLLRTCLDKHPKIYLPKESSSHKARLGGARYVILLLCVLSFVESAFPQNYLQATGVPPYTPNLPVELGIVNVSNGNLHLEIPLAPSYPQRGGGLLKASLVYDSRFWFASAGAWSPGFNWPVATGWRYAHTGAFYGAGPNTTTTTFCQQKLYNGVLTNYYLYTFSNISAVESNGTTHNFSLASNGAPFTIKFSQCDPSVYPGTGSAFADDLSGYFINIQSSWNGNPGNAPVLAITVYARDGTQVYPYWKDTNGNYFSPVSQVTSLPEDVTDTLDRQPYLTTSTSNGFYLDYLNPQGTRSRVTVTTVKIQVTTNFGTGAVEYSGPITVMKQITLADGTSYGFSYDSYGELASLTLPTGGQITYSYINFSDANSGVNRWLYSRTSSGGKWTYAPAVLGSCSGSGSCQQQVTVTKPSNDYSVYLFNLALFGRSSQVQYFSSGGTLLATTTSDYQTLSTTEFLKIRDTTILPLASSGSISKKTEYGYDSYDINITALKQWDFYANAAFPSTPDREVDNTYVTDTNYTSRNMISLLQTSVTQGTPQSQTKYQYDTAALQSTSGITQHDYTNFSTQNPYRGNLTSVSRWVNTNNTWATTSYTYNDLGNRLTATDGNGNATSYTYSLSFADAYVTQVTMPTTNSVQHITSTNYDFNTGLVTSSTDQNGNVTGFSYDDMFRPLSVDYPDHGQTTYGYVDSAPFTITETRTNTTGSLVSTTVLDGLGRTSQVQTTDTDCGTGLHYVDTAYDTNGRKKTVSNPYCTTSDETYGTTTYGYDGLDRITSVTHPDGSSIGLAYSGRATQVTDEGNGTSSVQRIAQFNAWGNLTFACEVSSKTLPVGSSVSPSACGLDIAANGFLTSYQYDSLGNLKGVSQPGLNARSFQYDSLSHLVSASNPESGTATYGYDNNGNMIQIVRPAPNQQGSVTVTTTYHYDALNRNYSIQYSDGTTPNVTLHYDQCMVSGVSVGNPIGRLVNVSTGSATGCSSTNSPSGITRSYDPMGRLANEWQTAPGISNPFALSYQYDLVGEVKSLTNSQGANFTYDYQGEHLRQVTSSLNDAQHPSTLFSAAKFNAFGGLTQATFGNGVTEDRSYNNRGWPSSITNASGVNPATPGTGSVSISGTEKSTVVQTQPATAATGTITISGSDQSVQINCEHDLCKTLWDSGTVSVTVNGFTVSTSYGQTSTASGIASALGSGLNASNSPVTASVSGATISLKTKQTGASTNYSMSGSSSTSDPTYFKSPSFSVSLSGSTLSGGKNAVFSTIYDNGVVSLTVGGHTDSTTWGQGDTAASVASKLTSSINADSAAPVTAVVSGATVSLTAKQTGSSTNYSLSSVSTSGESQYFSSPSFTVSDSGGTLTGGSDISGGVTLYSVSLNYAPDGDVIAANDKTNGNWAYAYDDFNRLITAVSSNTGEGCGWAYDRYGNRWQQNTYSGSCYTSSITFTAGTNRIDSYCYDAAGNLLDAGPCPLSGSHMYAYDAENRLVAANGGSSAGGTTYVYDALGRRIQRITGGAAVSFLYDAGGHVISELNQSGTWTRAEVYAAGRHIATYSGGSGGTTYFAHIDWLGTERVRTNMAGAACETVTSLPFGDGQLTTGSCGDPSPLHFTGKERDSESNLDNFEARYYSSQFGRFMSPDPLAGHREDPQTLNRYVYVRLNPLSLTDPTGLDSYLQCTPQKDENGNDTKSQNCQQIQIDKQNFWVQGTTDQNNKFNPTVVTSASLQDPNSGNTATVNENGVLITTQNGTSLGIFITGTPAANNVQGSGALQGFTFDINGNCNQTCLASGSWFYNGSLNAARSLLDQRGAFTIPFEDVVAGFGGGAHPFSTQHRFGGPDCSFLSCPDSPHLSVPYDPSGTLDPKNNVPATGGFHVDAHADWFGHYKDVTQQ